MSFSAGLKSVVVLTLGVGAACTLTAATVSGVSSSRTMSSVPPTTSQPVSTAIVGDAGFVQVGTDIDVRAGSYNGGVGISDGVDRIVVGCSGCVAASSVEAGWAQVYDWDGDLWQPAGEEIPGDEFLDDFGTGIAIAGDGSRIAIGAPRMLSNTPGYLPPGYVRVFTWDGAAWTQVGSDIEGDADGLGFGWSVDLSQDGSRVAIGPAEGGSTRVFQWDQGRRAWTQLGEDLRGGSSAVALSADGMRIAIGAPFTGPIPGPNPPPGHATVHEWDGGNWIQVGATLTGRSYSEFYGIGIALSSDGERLAVGAQGEDPTQDRVEVFDWDGTDWVAAGAGIPGPGRSIDLSADGNRLASSAGGAEVGGRASAAVIHDWDGAGWRISAQVAGAGELALSRDGSGLVVSADGLRVFEGSIPAPPPTVPVVSATSAPTLQPPGGTIPPTGLRASPRAGALALMLVAGGAVLLITARRRPSSRDNRV